jgi:NAD(P)-dependent dehydrogenase (short-subunit alcohol dehydrogenase family)
MKGKHVLITGASGGVGIETAKEFLKIGCICTLHYNSKRESLREIEFGKYSENVVCLQANVVDEHSVSQLIQESVTKFGPVEILVVCHGIWPTEDVLVKDMDYKRWRNTIEVNLDGTFLFIKHYLRQLDTASKTISEVLNPAIVLIGLALI